jgi:opacity protein-like surface antigen
MAALVLSLAAGAACAQSDTPWDGAYAGLSLGRAGNDTCNSWSPGGASIDSAAIAALSSRNCSNGSEMSGGVQIGENFQYKHLLWGIGADLDIWTGASHSEVVKYAGSAPPPGTYVVSGKLNPSEFAIIGPRIGYASRQWLPYLRVGALVSLGSRSGTLTYIPQGTTKPAAAFDGGANFASIGWAAGGGFEWGLNGPWSISVEYLHMNLGKGSNSATTCTGTASACAAFSGVSFDSTHSGFTANMFRIGFNYWFAYWAP